MDCCFNNLTPSYLAHQHAALHRGDAEISQTLGVGLLGKLSLRFFLQEKGSEFTLDDFATGSSNLALGTQQVKVGTGIPIHRHFQMDEAFNVLEGSGVFTLNEVRRPFEKGGTIFIPKNSSHGFANPDHELLLLWIVSPAGLDGFFRETCNLPGVPGKQLTREQINEIARKYAMEFR